MSKSRRSAARIPATKAGAIAQAPKPIPASESFRTLFANAYDQMQATMQQVAAMGYKDHGVDPTKYIYDHSVGAFLPKPPAPPAAKPSK